MRIGAHVSIAGGFDKSLAKAKELELECLQIFNGSPRLWKRPPFKKNKVEAFKRGLKEFSLSPIFIHGSYLLNLASHQLSLFGNRIFESSIRLLIEDLRFTQKIGALGVIFHVGSHKGAGLEAVLPQIVEGMKRILDQTEEGFLILENSAGAGGVIGADLKEINEIAKKVGDSRVKLCLDLCHAFVSGYDVRKQKGWNRIFKELGKGIGFKNLVCIHANDAKFGLGSRLDRHENLGEGKIGIEGLKTVFSQLELSDLPFIIETPGFDKMGIDKKNIGVLKRLRKEIL